MENSQPLIPQQSAPASSQPQAPTPEPNKARAFFAAMKSISGTLALFIIAPIFALFLTAHVFQPYEVDGASMETTLQNADRLIVYKLPKTLSNLTGNELSLNRWDVIVFDRPTDLSAPESTEHLIKRVIALPGERVKINNGKVVVFNQENPDGFNPDQGQSYTDGFSTTSGTVDITVGQGEVFVLGDNRENSTDSRVFGSIPKDIVVGRATARFVPINAMKQL